MLPTAGVMGVEGAMVGGARVVRALVTRGHIVTAAVRHPPVPGLATTRVCRVDALNQADVRAALHGQGVVVNAIGAGTLRRNDIESSTTAVAVAGAQEAGVERYIAMSAGMVALDWPVFKCVLKPLIFRNILAEHLRVEEIVGVSRLAWTIVRPPRLTNGPATGYLATRELQPRSFSASRADVAAFIADELEGRSYLRQAVFVTSRPLAASNAEVARANVSGRMPR